MPSGSFTSAGQSSDWIGDYPQYRLYATALSAGECDYYFDWSTFGSERHPLMILTTGGGGAWTGTIDIQYRTKDANGDWETPKNIPNESYTANDSRRLR